VSDQPTGAEISIQWALEVPHPDHALPRTTAG
jgi:hypothetical protein